MNLSIDTQTHKLQSNGAKFVASPNHGSIFANGTADTIVIHFTAGSSFDSSVSHLCRPEAKASAHVVIGRDGEICQLVPFNTIAWHAGRSRWKGRSGLNQFAIGIELDNAGELSRNPAGQYLSWFKRSYSADEVFEGVHRHKHHTSFWHAYSEAQIAATFDLCEALCLAYGITEIVGHEEISPGRKSDPGPAFPLEKLRMAMQTDRAEDGGLGTSGAVNQQRVVANKLNVRAGPSADFDVVSKPLVYGEKVKVLSSKNGWSRVEFTTSGWVSERYLDPD